MHRTSIYSAIFIFICAKSWQIRGLHLDDHLTNHWPINNGTMFDVVGRAHMTHVTGPPSIGFMTDRFGTPNSALDLNNAFTQIPPGVYFNTPFSITAWIKPNAVGYWGKLIDFGNGWKIDNIAVVVSKANTYHPSFHISDAATWMFQADANQKLSQSDWSFLTATFDGNTANVYVNGLSEAVDTSSKYFLPTVHRSKCYIGKSLQTTDGSIASYIDDLRFYNISFNLDQINELMSRPYDATTYAERFITAANLTYITSTSEQVNTESDSSSEHSTNSSLDNHVATQRDVFNSSLISFSLNSTSTSEFDFKTTRADSSFTSWTYSNVTDCDCTEYTPILCEYYSYHNENDSYVFHSAFDCSQLSKINYIKNPLQCNLANPDCLRVQNCSPDYFIRFSV